MFSKVGKTYQKIFDNVPAKDDRHLEITQDPERFYKSLGNVFYVPIEDYLKKHNMDFPILEREFQRFYDKDLDYVDPSWTDFEKIYVTGEKDTIRAINRLMSAKEITVDIESKNLSFYDNELLLITFSWHEDKAMVIDTFTDKTIRRLKRLFSREDITFVWHNGKFDISRLKAMTGIDARIDEDTMLLHYTGYNEIRGTHGLEYLAQLYLDAPDWGGELDLVKRKVCREKKIRLSEFNYAMFPHKDLVDYAFIDGIATYRLYKLFKKSFPKKSEFIYYKLIEASNVFAEIELTGVYADKEMIDFLANNLEEELKEIEENIRDLTKDIWQPKDYMTKMGAKSATEEFNPNSPNQVRYVFQRLGHTLENTSEATLKKIDEPLAKEILRLRHNTKYRKTYVYGLAQEIEKDGRIHTSFNLHGTETGRISSSGPNLQNIPRDKTIKNIFRATPGYVLTQADYSQAELRVLSVLSNAPWLQGVYKRGEDLHSAIARQYWGDGFTSEDRNKAKTVNFGIAYGMTEHTLSDSLKISKEEARTLLTEWFTPQPEVKTFFNEKVRTALQGIPAYTFFGRKRNFIVTKKNKFNIRNQAMNTPIQATASDLTIFSLIEIHKELKERKLGRIVLTVHDSIIVENKPEDTEAVTELMKRHMSEVPKYYLETDVPFVADIDSGILWGEID